MTEAARLPNGEFFVDREKEKEYFERALRDSQTPPILMLYGSSGMGKTLMIDRIQHGCDLDGIQAARIDFYSTNAKNNDFIQVCRRIRDQWGAEMFGPFTDKLNWCTTLGYAPMLPWSLDADQRLQDESWLNAPCENPSACRVRDRFEPLRPMLRGQIDQVLTYQFLVDAKRLARKKPDPIVCLFDDAHKADPATRKWLWDLFLSNLPRREEERIVAVIAVDEPPEVDVNSVPVQIDNLSRESVECYGKAHGITSMIYLTMLWVLSEYGCPQSLPWALNITQQIDELLASENEAQREKSLRTQLDIHRKNLNYLQEQAAKQGSLNVPLDLKNEIDAEVEEIDRLRLELARL